MAHSKKLNVQRKHRKRLRKLREKRKAILAQSKRR